MTEPVLELEIDKYIRAYDALQQELAQKEDIIAKKDDILTKKDDDLAQKNDIIAQLQKELLELRANSK